MLSEKTQTSEMLNTILSDQDLSFIKELESDLSQIHLETNFQKEKYNILNNLVDILNNIIQNNSNYIPNINFKKGRKNKKKYKNYDKDILFKQLLLEETNNTINLINSNIQNMNLIENNLNQVNDNIISLLSAIETGIFEQEYTESKITDLTSNIDVFSKIFEKTNSEIKDNNRIINDFFNRNEEMINSILNSNTINSIDNDTTTDNNNKFDNNLIVNNSNLANNNVSSNIIEELYNNMINSNNSQNDIKNTVNNIDISNINNNNINNNNNNVVSTCNNDIGNLATTVNNTNAENNNIDNINIQNDNIENNNNNIDNTNANNIDILEKNSTDNTQNDISNIVNDSNNGKTYEINASEEKNVNIYSYTEENEKDINSDNLTLIISEKDNKVYLPYKVSEIQAYLEQFPEKYINFEDVIEKEFIISLDNYTKHPAIARFRETYSLIRDREYKSISESLKASLELMFRTDINPAIIAACKTEEQLENYVDCLEREKLENFKHFKIEFKVNPLKI